MYYNVFIDVGPPGTGKTSTILGLVSALLHVDHKKSSSSQSGSIESEKLEGNNLAEASSLSAYVAPIMPSKRRLLICAPSNAAIDEVLTRIKSQGIFDDASQSYLNNINRINRERREAKIVRLGEPLEGASALVHAMALESQVEASVKTKAEHYRLHQVLSELQVAQNDLEEFRKMNPEIRGNIFEGNRSNPQQSENGRLNQLYKKLKELLEKVNRLKRERTESEIALDMLRSRIRVELLVDAEVVGATLSSSGRNQFIDHIIQQNITFETVIIDEAGQTTEPGTLLPLRFGCKKLILVGDPRQLPATVLSRYAEANGLGRSLFERLEQAEHEVVMLTVQYRMHPEIRKFPSAQFYQNKLTDGDHITREVARIEEGEVFHGSVTSPLLAKLKIPPVTFYDSSIRDNKGSNAILPNPTEIMENQAGNSYINTYECHQIIDFLSQILPQLNKELSIAIITPYAAQVRRLWNECKRHPVISQELRSRVKEENRIEINSVDGFQGREKDVVIFSSVRCNNIQHRNVKSVIGFVADERRLNVAITRAKKSLIIFGNSATLSVDSMWANFIKSLEERNAVRYGREGLYRLPSSLQHHK